MKVIMVVRREFKDSTEVPTINKLQEEIPGIQILSEEGDKYIYIEVTDDDYQLLKTAARKFYLIEKERFLYIEPVEEKITSVIRKDEE